MLNNFTITNLAEVIVKLPTSQILCLSDSYWMYFASTITKLAEGIAIYLGISLDEVVAS